MKLSGIQHLAYAAGVLRGDAWLTKVLGLRCKDEDFAIAFADALAASFGTHQRPRRDERGYWLLRIPNRAGRFDGLRSFSVLGDEAAAAWLRGLFDSEGNAQLVKAEPWENSWRRRVAVYSTSLDTLHQAAALLAQLGMPTHLRAQKASVTHKGTKQVYELSLAGSRASYATFAAVVGSSIARKQATLDAIVASYSADLSAALRAAQAKGAASRRARTMAVTLPAVVAAIRSLIDSGVKPTQRNCAGIRGFYNVASIVGLPKLVAMAEALR